MAVAVAYPVMLVLAVLSLFVANVLLWVDSSLLNGSEFSSSVNHALAKPAVQERTADVIARQVVENGTLRERLQAQLPADLAFAGPLLASQLEPLIADVALRLIQTDTAGDIRNVAVSRLHSTVIQVLEGQDSAVQADGDSLVLNLQPVVQRVFEQLNVAAPPAVQSGEFGRYVLVEDASGLREASFLVRNRTEIALGGLLLTAALFGAAIFLAPTTRRGVLFCGYAIAGTGLLTLLLLFAGNRYMAATAEDALVVREILRALGENLRLQSAALIILGACIIAVSDRRVFGLLERGWEYGGGVVERHGASRVALVGIAAGTVLLLVI